MAFMDDLRDFVLKGGGGNQGTGMGAGAGDLHSMPMPMGPGAGGATPTGPGVTPGGVRMPAPRPFVAPPGAPPMGPVGRPTGAAPGFAALPPMPGGTVSGAPPTGAPPMPGAMPGAPPAPATPSPTVSGGEATAGPDGAPSVPPDPLNGLGTLDPVTGNVNLSPQGKAEYQKRMAEARTAFGPYPKANDPSTPPPPIVPGKLFFNPFTGTYGKA